MVDDSVIDMLRQVYVKKLRDSGFEGRISTYYTTFHAKSKNQNYMDPS